jgi:hypothetical protein
MLKKPEEILEYPIGFGKFPTPPDLSIDVSNLPSKAIASLLQQFAHKPEPQAPLVLKGDKFDINEASFEIGALHEITVKKRTYIVRRASEHEFTIFRVVK